MVLDIHLLQPPVDPFGQSVQEVVGVRVGLFDHQPVPWRFAPDGHRGELIEFELEFAGAESNRFDDLRFGDLLTGDVRDVCPLVQESQQGCRPTESGAADHVADVVAIQARPGCQQDVVVAVALELVGLENGGPRAAVFFGRDELVVV